jgi:tetratricopeptide (TPR) repeat protein
MQRKKIIPFINNVIKEHFEGIKDANAAFLTGEAGIGKTTLLAEFKTQYENLYPGNLVLITECSTPIAGYDIGAVESLHPWTNILSKLTLDAKTRHSHKKEFLTDLSLALIKLVPYIGNSISDTAKALKKFSKAKEVSNSQNKFTEQQQIFNQYINLLSKVSAVSPLILIFDDFHWADNSSTDLLFAASRQLINNKIFFIISYREEDAFTSRGGKGHPVQTVRNEIERYSMSHEIKVDKFDAADIKEFLIARYDSYSPEEYFENWLLKHSGGNPLFSNHLLRTLEEDDIINVKNGNISDKLDDVKVPDSVNAVIRVRINRLSEDIKELLRYASVEGDKFTSFVLSRITNTPPLKLLQILRQLEDVHRIIKSLGKQLVYSEETTSYQFANTLYAKILYESLGDEEKELLHRLIYDLLKTEREMAVEKCTNLTNINRHLAIHAEVVGDLFLAAKLLYDNAFESWKLFSEKETLQLTDKSLELADKSLTANPGEKTLLILKGNLYLLSGEVNSLRVRYARAVDDYFKAIEVFKEAGNDELLIEAMNRSAWEKGKNLHNFSVAEKICTDALDLARRKNLLFEAAKVLNTLGFLYSFEGRAEEAMETLGKSLDIKKELGDKHAIAVSLTNISTLFFNEKDFEKGIKYNLEALELLKQYDNISAIYVCLHNLGTLYEVKGDYDKSLKYNFEGLKLAEKIGNPVYIANCNINIGDVYVKQQKHEPAIEYLTNGLNTYRELGEKSWQKDLLEDLLKEYRIIGNEEKCRQITDELKQLEESMN